MTTHQQIEKRMFGRTGHMSTVTIFGAAALASVSQAEADRTLDLLLEYGVNHIDTAASYGDSELRIGPWMDRHRKEFFLATKTGQRTYAAAREEIHRSLERLRVDSVDLIQLHNLVHPDEWDVAMGPGGALEACIEAREQGLVRFIGVTGHGRTVAAMHRRSLLRFDFDSVLLPYNYVVMQDEVYEHDFELLFKLCQERNVAVQTIKSITRGPWATAERTRATWYQPLEDQRSIDLAVHWVMGRPGVFLNTVGDIQLLPKVLDAAARFERRPTDEEMKRLMEEEHMSTLFV
ncbi:MULTISPECIES: aldo/keto reductase [Caldilinea]|jgi:aryl-alcohol dehydrogenase-like predicted oxidoreductase|nr:MULTISPECIES: aldo/keto reductase [Caldilinea]MBO9394494.1 aldo/keto reductase [Caldilinea sp.]GIV73855.1 MAG: oxidoreductase [Caldilinea sp.]